MKFSVWIEQTIVRATVVVVEADDADHAEELAAMAAEDGRPWSHVEVTHQNMEVRAPEDGKPALMAGTGGT